MSQEILGVLQEIKKIQADIQKKQITLCNFFDQLQSKIDKPNESLVYYCDGCGQEINGRRRMHCEQCIDYDLCIPCFEQNLFGLRGDHRRSHTMAYRSPILSTKKISENLMSQKILGIMQENEKMQVDIEKGQITLRHLLDQLQSKTDKPNESLVYYCDGCGHDIDGRRMHCEQCVDYDLCIPCFEQNRFGLKNSHRKLHTMSLGFSSPKAHRSPLPESGGPHFPRVPFLWDGDSVGPPTPVEKDGELQMVFSK